MSRIIGTAGHVDHGKTTLIHALTGIDADRLPEEKERGMTIDIGFAYMDLPEIGRVSIIDVPGHEKFLTNMLVGAMAMDVVLLCVAADEGVKPQTREHLQILDLLPVERLVVALTRVDRVDHEMVSLATEDVHQVLEGTRFSDAAIIPVSATTGTNFEELRSALRAAIIDGGSKESSLPWYLPVDRVFSLKGHGPVVTGPLVQGTVASGELAVLQPGEKSVRVRAIHSHGESVDRGKAGTRLALNISGISVEELRRGQAIGAPGALFESSVLDLKVRWIGPKKHAMRVRISIGADEAYGRIFLDREDESLTQVRLDHPVAVALNQPLIIRRYSPPTLLGGGRVLVPQAQIRRKSKALALPSGSTMEEQLVAIVALEPHGQNNESVCRLLGKTPQLLGPVFESLVREGKVIGFAGLWFTPESWALSKNLFLQALDEAHQRSPNRASLPRETVIKAAGLPWEGKPLDRILSRLAEDKEVVLDGSHIRATSFQPSLPTKQRNMLDRVLQQLNAAGVNSPNVHQLSLELNVPSQAIEEITKLGRQLGELIILDGGIIYPREQVERVRERLISQFGGNPFTAAEAKEFLQTSRKYIIPLLEHLDAKGVTLRQGDKRVLRRHP